MRAWVYVEGEADRLALEALWDACKWTERLQAAGHGIRVLALNDKSRFLKVIGDRAARRLVESDVDVAVGLPDLYPCAVYDQTRYPHRTLAQLAQLQTRLVSASLLKTFGVPRRNGSGLLDRFLGWGLRHDLEALLLGAEPQLRDYLECAVNLGSWSQVVEDQDDQRPPKRVVEAVFRSRSASKRAYRDTLDAPAVLRRVTDLRNLILFGDGRVRCPAFKELLDWLAQRTGVSAY